MELKQVRNVVEAALMAFDEPMSMKALVGLFPDEEITANDINQVLNDLDASYQDRGIELKKLSKGYRLQTRESVQPWLQNMWQQKPKKLSRALLETLALIAYRQPITRGEIEDIRGVAVSSKIIHYMMDKEWIRILGYRDVPGKPAMLGTTKEFLDYFNLASLQDLPSLAEIKDIETLEQELQFGEANNENTNEAAAADSQSKEVQNNE
ncbi:SMC-Scp complex subunit ScpB [Marinicella sp. S1101]|uniref:SMC-Scp complex subunit ScpB n=1 Tax=Marinicella marina TaxID=2996016 RepID=UPI002260D8C5|nr:SMC-Scp complex subunit ScpB [Marinicella marina]MCX7552862.1 SMC-Scp complex subunit ScpB [Marinicella marina]MDJ1139829.1 SMC-Scp complex subunit ScpB [Marinicella marina]